MSAGCRTASIPVARAGAGSGSGASEDPEHKALPRKRLPDDSPGAAADKEIHGHLDFTFPFIGRFDDRDLRGEFTREDREAASTRCGSPWMSWGISHNA